MSQENVEIVREVMAAWNTHDIERWIRCWDPGCRWLPRLRGQVEGTQTYRGHEGLRRYWEEDEAVWDTFVMEVHQVRPVNDEVIATGTATACGKESGVEITRPLAFRFQLRDRRIVRGESFLDISEALQAVGLAEPDAHASS
jgi:ketosteroid isomerase-like protein